jgi:hypothetical protein
MKTSSIFGLASAVVRSRKFKIVLVGLQLGFLVVKYLTGENEEKESENPKKDKKLLTDGQ